MDDAMCPPGLHCKQVPGANPSTHNQPLRSGRVTLWALLYGLGAVGEPDLYTCASPGLKRTTLQVSCPLPTRRLWSSSSTRRSNTSRS